MCNEWDETKKKKPTGLASSRRVPSRDNESRCRTKTSAGISARLLSLVTGPGQTPSLCRFFAFFWTFFLPRLGRITAPIFLTSDLRAFSRCRLRNLVVEKSCTRDATTQLVKDIVEEKEKSTVETNELDILAKRPTNMTSVEVGTAG